jgi:hypothetical protein
MSNVCRPSNAVIVFKNDKVRAREAKVMAIHANSLVRLKVKLCLNQHRRGAKGAKLKTCP